jgi:hypothetical protein
MLRMTARQFKPVLGHEWAQAYATRPHVKVVQHCDHTMTPQQIAALTAYVQAINANPTRDIFGNINYANVKVDLKSTYEENMSILYWDANRCRPLNGAMPPLVAAAMKAAEALRSQPMEGGWRR